ncbi:MAG: glycosyltransferase family 39 protein [Chloroflexi bacterium]|nr:glycosyltransferase family 39 protein [Chloroflexota bacterium]
MSALRDRLHLAGPEPLVALVTVLGALWRLASVRFNVWPHGDVVIDAAIAESVAWQGRLLVPFVDVRYYPSEPFGFGYPPDQHPPLWPLLGALLVPLTDDGYSALKVVSLLVGVALVPLTFVGLRRHVGQPAALFATVLAACSFPLADFSGNGSLWVLLAACYLGWLWLIPCDVANMATSSRNTSLRWAGLGAVMGVGYLTNYPAVVLPIALLALHLVRHRLAAFRPQALAGPAISAVVMLLVILPWLAYNAAQFGGPFWSQPFQRTLAGGSRQVEYVLVNGQAVKRNLPQTASRAALLRERALDLYGNVGFLVKQSLVIAPILAGLFALGLVLLVPGTPRLRESAPAGQAAPPEPNPIPVAVLALAHLALIVWWPTTKFRYLIPLLPLVFGIGAWALGQIGPVAVRHRLAAITAALCLFTNAWTMLSIPSRTYYYNGGLVGDNFGQQGERIFMEDAARFRAAADAIVARGQGTILADHILAPFTRMPLVVNSTGYPPDIIEHLIEQYGIRYIVIDVPHANLYDFLTPDRIWSDEKLTVLEVRPRAVTAPR